MRTNKIISAIEIKAGMYVHLILGCYVKATSVVIEDGWVTVSFASNKPAAFLYNEQVKVAIE